MGSNQPSQTKPSARTTGVAPAVHQLTGEVRRLLAKPNNAPIGVLTAYNNAILRLADAIDRVASEIDSRDAKR